MSKIQNNAQQLSHEACLCGSAGAQTPAPLPCPCINLQYIFETFLGLDVS